MRWTSKLRPRFFFAPSMPVLYWPSVSTVFHDPYETEGRNDCSDGTSPESKLMEPPKVLGPIVEAVPGLRSKSTLPIQTPGKKTQEWGVGVLVLSKGMPSHGR